MAYDRKAHQKDSPAFRPSKNPLYDYRRPGGLIIWQTEIDEEDVKSILAKNKDAIDFEYVNKWLSEFGKIAEHEGMLARFNRLLRK